MRKNRDTPSSTGHEANASDGEAGNRVRNYLHMRKVKPMPQLGDIIHSVNVGSTYEGELLLSDLNSVIQGFDDLLECLKAAVQIIGHPDDSMTKLFVETIAKAEGRTPPSGGVIHE